jgi:hypothetical protein
MVWSPRVSCAAWTTGTATSGNNTNQPKNNKNNLFYKNSFLQLYQVLHDFCPAWQAELILYSDVEKIREILGLNSMIFLNLVGQIIITGTTTPTPSISSSSPWSCLWASCTYYPQGLYSHVYVNTNVSYKFFHSLLLLLNYMYALYCTCVYVKLVHLFLLCFGRLKCSFPLYLNSFHSSYCTLPSFLLLCCNLQLFPNASNLLYSIRTNSMPVCPCEH